MEPKRNLASLADNRYEDQLIKALRGRSGRATLGDLVVDTGLPRGDVEAQIQRLLSLYKSHLEVDENGELLYLFDPSFKRRDASDGRLLYDLGKKAYGVFKAVFKVTIMVVLVAYFVLFVVLIIAAMFSGRSNSNSSSSSSSGSSRGGTGIIWWFWGSPSYRSGRRSGVMGRSGRGQSEDKDDRPFYRKVFAYVFGPEAEAGDAEERLDEKLLLAFIRANKGVITVADLMAHTGWTRLHAEEELSRIMVAYQGDVHVTSNGVILYTFNQLAVSASGGAAMPAPAWGRLTTPEALTGNSGGTNAIITFLNGFNMLAAMSAPVWAPALLVDYGIAASPLIWFVLSIFPLLFSLIFFAIPILRALVLHKEKRRLAQENARRLVLSEVFARAAQRDASQRILQPAEVVRRVEARWTSNLGKAPSSMAIKGIFQRMVTDLEADIKTEASGQVVYQFPDIALQLQEARAYRGLIDPAELRLGRIVFSSSEEDADHGFDQFDAELGGNKATPLSANQLQRAAPELGEFDAALGASGGGQRDAQTQAQFDDFERRLEQAEEVAVTVDEPVRK